MAVDQKLGEAFVEITGRMDKLSAEFKRAQKESEAKANSMSNSFKSAFGKLLATGGALLLFRKALSFANEAKNVARDAEEIRSKFDQVFSSMRREANKTADAFADSFGLAGSTSRELLSSTGDLLVGFGFAEKEALSLSNRVNSLAQDLASFQNFSGGAKGASDALTKALLGETESAKSLDIVIRQNTKEFRSQVASVQQATGKTAQQAKAVVILEEAYKQSTKAVGDYSRTRDSVANRERENNESLKEAYEILGNRIIPVYRSLLSALGGLAKQYFPVQKESDKLTESAVKQVAEFDVLTSRYLQLAKQTTRTESQQKLFNDTVKQLNDLYPNYLSKVDLHKSRLEDVKTAFSEARTSLVDYTNSLVRQAVIQEKTNEIAKVVKDIYQANKQLLDAQALSLEERNELSKQYGDAYVRNEEEVRKSIREIALASIKVAEEQRKQLESDIEGISALIGDFTAPEDGGGGGNLLDTSEDVQSLETLTNKLKVLKGEYSKIDATDKKSLKAKAKEILLVEKQIEALQSLIELKDNASKIEEERLATLKQSYEKFYEDLKWGATDYYDFRLSQIQAEYEAMAKFIEDTVLLEQWKAEQIKQLDAERLEAIQEFFQTINGFGGAVDQTTESFQRQNDAIYEGANAVVALGQQIDSLSGQGKSALSVFNELLKTFISISKAISALEAGGSALSGGLGIFSSILGVFGLFGAHSGGSFKGTSKGVKKMAKGGSFIVPPGNPNDSYPLMVESGERVKVTPASKTLDDKVIVSAINNLGSRIEATNVMIGRLDTKPVINIVSTIDGVKFIEDVVNPASDQVSEGIRFDD